MLLEIKSTEMKEQEKIMKNLYHFYKNFILKDTSVFYKACSFNQKILVYQTFYRTKGNMWMWTYQKAYEGWTQ